MAQRLIQIETSGAGLYEFTRQVQSFAHETGCDEGVMTLFVRHTSCSLLIQENADDDVKVDLNQFFKRLVPPSNDPSMNWVIHTMEGPDDMPAHIKASILPVSLSVPIYNSQLVLGTWQGIYLFEHRDRPHCRDVVLHVNAS